MVIAKTASRNVAFKVAKLGVSVFAGQSDILTLTCEVATAGFSTDEEVLEDLGRNADLYLYIFFIRTLRRIKLISASF